MLKNSVRLGMVVENFHELFSFKQSKLWELYISFNVQKRNRTKNYFEKDFFIRFDKAALGKMMENIRNRLNKKLIKSNYYKKI